MGPELHVIYAKIGFSIGFVILSALGLLEVRRKSSLLSRSPLWVWLIGVVGLRAAILFLLVFLLKMSPRGDLTGYYLPQARNIFSGFVPYRDFDSSYGFFFPYIVAGLSRGGAFALPVVLFGVVMDGLAYYFGARFFFRERPSRGFAAYSLLFCLSPISVWSTGINGTNNSWIAAGLVGALWLLSKSNAAAGIGFVVLAFCTKFLAFLYFPLVFKDARKRAPLMLGAVGFAALLAAMLFYLRASPVASLAKEANRITSGTLPFLFGLLGEAPSDLSRIWQGVALAALALVVLLLLTARDVEKHAVAAGGVALHCAFALFSPKAYPIYIVMVLPIFAAWSAQDTRPWRAYVFLALSALATIETSVWFMLGEATLDRFQAPMSVWQIVFIFLECSIVTAYACALATALVDLLKMSAPLAAIRDYRSRAAGH